MKTLRTVALACALGYIAASAPAAAGATDAGTQAVVDWNVTALDTARVSSGVREGHNVALAQAAVFDAVNSISRRYRPYRVRIKADGTESVEAAVASAAHTVLLDRYPDQQAGLDAALASSLDRVPDGEAEARASRSAEPPPRPCWPCARTTAPMPPCPTRPAPDRGSGSRPRPSSARRWSPGGAW